MKARMLLLWIVLLFVSSGASCPRSRQIVNDYAPVVLTEDATMADVIRVVNANSARIQQIQSSGAKLTVAGMPSLDASYAFDRPQRFRLRAETRLTGPELDLGSNDDTYWIWVRQSEQPAVYWGRHEGFYSSAARQVLPVPPSWLIEALGVVRLDPTGQHEGPLRNRPGQLEIRTVVSTPDGPLTKVTVVDSARGWVVEQHLYDARQQHLASALAAGFQFDPVTGTSLPRVVEIRLPPAQLEFTLTTESHHLNRLVGDPSQLWTVPQINGVPMVDLNHPNPIGYQQSRTLMARRPSKYGLQNGRISADPAIRRTPPFNNLR